MNRGGRKRTKNFLTFNINLFWEDLWPMFLSGTQKKNNNQKVTRI